MMEYLKYLPLLQVIGKHPTLVNLLQEVAAKVQPHIPEINQAVDEIQTMLAQINGGPKP